MSDNENKWVGHSGLSILVGVFLIALLYVVTHQDGPTDPVGPMPTVPTAISTPVEPQNNPASPGDRGAESAVLTIEIEVPSGSRVRVTPIHRIGGASPDNATPTAAGK